MCLNFVDSVNPTPSMAHSIVTGNLENGQAVYQECLAPIGDVSVVATEDV